MQLVHLPPDPRDLVPEVNLVAQFPAAGLARAQRVQRRLDDGRGRLLVVEDAQGRDGDDEQEDGQGARPDAPGLGHGREGAVGAAGHQGSGVGAWGGDEGAVVWGGGWAEGRAKRAEWEAVVGKVLPIGEEEGTGGLGRHLFFLVRSICSVPSVVKVYWFA